MAIFATVTFYCASALAGLFVFDRALSAALSWLAPLLPNDMCGPDGWLIDQKNRSGVFDRSW
ncbi:MAG: hypothetical protein AAGH17_01760 [Pseudomonadota bacterium]